MGKYWWTFLRALVSQRMNNASLIRGISSSKRESCEYCKTLLEPPKYHLQDVYRVLSIIAEESDFIQSELYQNSNFIHPRNKKILYYDCTNFYFETEQEDELRKYGKSKEHRPNPIATMALFMDADDYQKHKDCKQERNIAHIDARRGGPYAQLNRPDSRHNHNRSSPPAVSLTTEKSRKIILRDFC